MAFRKHILSVSLTKKEDNRQVMGFMRIEKKSVFALKMMYCELDSSVPLHSPDGILVSLIKINMTKYHIQGSICDTKVY